MQRGFILQSSYRIESGRPVVHLYGRLESGATFLVRDDRQVPTFYVRQRDAGRARELGARPLTPADRVTLGGGEPVVTVHVPVPPDTPALRDRLHRAGIPTWEADVRFAVGYQLRRGLRGAIAITGEGRPGRGVDLCFENPELAPARWALDPKVLSLDIETDPGAKRLLSVALYGCGASEVLLFTPRGWSCPPEAVACSSEAEVLRSFARRVQELDPDVLIGWNVIDFDLTVLLAIARRCGVELPLGRGGGEVRLRPGSSRLQPSTAAVPGRVVLDGPQLLRGAFIKLERYSLDFVARAVLGEGKTMAGHNRAEQILHTFRHDRPHFVEYNRTDARLALEILERLGLVRLAVERSLLTGLTMDRVAGSIAAFDFLYMSELFRRRVVAPTVTAPGQRAESFEDDDPDLDTEVTSGGYVLEPLPGLYRNVLVLDFKSLYPSLIRTFQIDPLGYLPHPGLADDPIVAPNGAAFRREGGVLPGLLDELFPRREAARRAGDGVASQAIKILMNSFYGVLGTSACRFHNPALANAITSFGRQLLLWSKERIEGYGHRVLYGDTDSLFVEVGVEDSGEARRRGEELAERLNADLAAHIEATWRMPSRLELEFEELYLRLVLPAMRHSAAGARKRYVGLVADGASAQGKVVFTGMEVVRRDWTELARQVQRQLYERLFSDRPVADYLRRVVADVRAGKLDELLIYRKALRKGLEEYTASRPPHVVAARKMGRRAGRLISYVIARSGPEPVDEASDQPLDGLEPDHEHYVQKQVRPVAEPVLDLLGLDFKKVVGDDRQLELF